MPDSYFTTNRTKTDMFSLCGHAINDELPKLWTQIYKTIFGPRQANLVLIAYASSEGSGEPAHPRSLAQAVSQEEPSDRKPDPWPF